MKSLMADSLSVFFRVLEDRSVVLAEAATALPLRNSAWLRRLDQAPHHDANEGTMKVSTVTADRKGIDVHGVCSVYLR